MELKYKLTNNDSGEVRTWEGDAKKAHRTLRSQVRLQLGIFPNSTFKVEIDGSDNELVKTYLGKAFNYIKNHGTPKTPKQPKGTGLTLKSTPENPIFENIMKAVKKGELTELEGLFMNWLLKEGFYAETHFSDVVVGDIAVGLDLPVNTIKGVLGSLTKKDYTYTQTNECYDIVYATSKGYQLDDDYDNRWKSGDW